MSPYFWFSQLQPLPIAGTAMPILDTTTCMMACWAALTDSPNRLPFSSVTGMPYFNSLLGGDADCWVASSRAELRRRRSYLCLMKGMLMQFAAATAAKGTKRLTMGGRRYERYKHTKNQQKKKKKIASLLNHCFDVMLPWPVTWGPGRWQRHRSWHSHRPHRADWKYTQVHFLCGFFW